ncbi:MFS transporter [Notoacmeibacter ruber]|nr:MFS transporter [Notoacmeibacter ruber]
MLLASLGTSIVNIALPTLSLVFDASFHEVQWVVIVYLATLTVFVVPAGGLGDRFGRQRVLVFGLVLFSSASAFCGLASNLWLLIAARAAQGVGAAFMMTLTIALVRETIATARVGQTMGLLGTMSAIGTALGPSMGGLLAGWLGWRAIFMVLAPIGVLTAFLVLRALPDNAPSRGSARIDLSAFRDLHVLPYLIANFLVANIMMATLIVGPFYLAFALGLREAIVGMVMSIGPAISICAGVPSGRLVDMKGPRPVLSLGLIVLLSGAILLAMLPQIAGLSGYIMAIVVLTPGYQMFQSANNTLVMADVPTDRRGAISGLLGLSRNVGLVSGASIMGMIFNWGVGSSAIESAAPSAIVSGMRLTFLVGGASIAAALWFVRKRQGERFAL